MVVVIEVEEVEGGDEVNCFENKDNFEENVREEREFDRGEFFLLKMEF